MTVINWKQGSNMTEAEWLECTDCELLLAGLDAAATERKLRLFACACVIMTDWVLLGINCESVIRTAERLADGLATAEESNHAAEIFYQATANVQNAPRYFAAAVAATLRPAAIEAAGLTWDNLDTFTWEAFNGELGYARIFRDIFGNPFRPVTLDPRWLTSTVVDLAQAIYEERAFDRMPILADALMDAGCDNEEIINHCRSNGPHVRGCWVVDLILSKDR